MTWQVWVQVRETHAKQTEVWFDGKLWPNDRPRMLAECHTRSEAMWLLEAYQRASPVQVYSITPAASLIAIGGWPIQRRS